MSKPVSPIDLSVYKIVREYEQTGRTCYPKEELYEFAEKVLKVASEIDNEDYWLICHTPEVALDFQMSLSNICYMSTSIVRLNEKEFKNGGKEWAERKIGLMPYSFLKGAIKVLEEEFEINEMNIRELQCD